jgi:S1-C subfamily serine protease
MMFSEPDKGRPNRSTVWLTVGLVFAIGVLVGFRLDPRWLRPIATLLPDRFAPASSSAEAIAASNPVDGGVGNDNSRSSPGVGLDRARDREGVLGPGQPAEDHDLSGHGPHADADAALFAAQERLDWQIAVAMSRARQSVVALEYTAADAPPGTRRMASGVVINQRGELLSVRIDAPSAGPASGKGTGRKPATIVARDFSGRRHAVQWVAADPETGLTLLRLAPRAVRPIRMAADEPNLGSQVFVVGNPFGMGNSVSRGQVAGLDRTLELSARQLGGLLQVQAPLCPGDSGAAVVNLRGDWLGLIRSGLAIPSSGSGRGAELGSEEPAGFSSSMALTDLMPVRLERDNDFGFAIPARDVLWVADQLRTHGRVDRAYLGVRLEPGSAAGLPVQSSIQAEANFESGSVESEGATLHEVLAGTPAAAAGLQPGDSIVALDGRPIRSTHDLTDKLDRIPARTTILLSIIRSLGPGQQRISLTLRTASRPDPPQLASPAPLSTPPPERPTVPVAVTATLAVTTPASPLVSSPTMDAARSRLSGVAFSLPASKSVLQNRPEPPPSVIQPNELQLTLLRAVIERLEQVERRLEKLESSTARASGPAAAIIARSVPLANHKPSP